MSSNSYFLNLKQTQQTNNLKRTSSALSISKNMKSVEEQMEKSYKTLPKLKINISSISNNNSKDLIKSLTFKKNKQIVENNEMK